MKSHESFNGIFRKVLINESHGVLPTKISGDDLDEVLDCEQELNTKRQFSKTITNDRRGIICINLI